MRPVNQIKRWARGALGAPIVGLHPLRQSARDSSPSPFRKSIGGSGETGDPPVGKRKRRFHWEARDPVRDNPAN